jgi:hypothetical protein
MVGEPTGTCDSAPVKLYAAPNTVDTTPKDHSAVLIEFNVMCLRIIRCVKVVGVCRVLGCQCVDTFNEGCDTKGFAMRTDGGFVCIDESSNLPVSEALPLGSLYEVFRYSSK